MFKQEVRKFSTMNLF